LSRPTQTIALGDIGGKAQIRGAAVCLAYHHGEVHERVNAIHVASERLCEVLSQPLHAGAVPELRREAGYREGSAGGVEAAEWEERRRVIELQNEEARREKKRRKQQAEVEARAQVNPCFI
jgi:hypothetical protein